MMLKSVVSRLGVANAVKVKLLEKFASVDELMGCSKEEVELRIQKPIDSRRWTLHEAVMEAERDARAMERQGIGILAINEAAYPPQLKEIHDAPALLWWRGTTPSNEETLIGIVGTRKPRTAACVWTRAAARELAENGVWTVSGLALGIDTMAHRGCLDGGGKTVAVMGTGIDTIYPPGNADVARRILSTGGCLFSEYPPGAGGTRWTFPARNRIIAGLARSVLVVEAPEKSGALITAERALEEGRDVLVAAKNGECFGAGCRKLASDGATMVENAADVLREWGRVARAAKAERNGDAVGDLAAELGFDLK
jgi:DNA processing protein